MGPAPLRLGIPNIWVMGGLLLWSLTAAHMPAYALEAATATSAQGQSATPYDARWSRLATSPTLPPPSRPLQLARTPAPGTTSIEILGSGGSLIIEPDIALLNHPGTDQSEISIWAHPTNPEIVLAGANASSVFSTIVSQGWYYSTDGGASWDGNDTLPTHSNLNNYMSDPAVGIDLDGNLFFNALEYGPSTGDCFVIRSTDNGTSWSKAVVPNLSVDEDKNHMAIDIMPASPFVHNVYAAYTEFQPTPSPIEFSRSTDRGLSFSTPLAISDSVGALFAQGINLATGPSGEVYAAWSGYDSWPPPVQTHLGFNRSTDGGVTWSGARTLRMVDDLRGLLGKGSDSVRVASFPSMAVDRGTGPRSGWIYIVYPERTGTRPDIFMVRSSNGGTSWSTPVRVNQDTSSRDQWYPWASVDPTTGTLVVVYYDSRRFAANDSAEVFISVSADGGVTFEDVLVSDVPFHPAPIAGHSAGYMGDYIGVTALDGIVWPCWNDSRTGIHQAYTSHMVLIQPGTPPTLRVTPDTLHFGDVYLGDDATRTISVRNLGFPETLVVSSITVDHPDFTTNFSSLELPGGVSQAVEVTFTPAAPGLAVAHISLTSNDTANPTVEVLLTANARACPVLAFSPSQLSDTVYTGGSKVDTLIVKNTGPDVLDFSFPEFDLPPPLSGSGGHATSPDVVAYERTKGAPDPRFGVASPNGFGGPDSSGYRWIDSDEPGGPSFSYVDISATGTLVSGLSDDNYVGPFPVGFEFPFYDSSYTQFWVQSNGVITFHNQYITLSNQPIPTPDGYNDLIAWCWRDLWGLTGQVRYKTLGDRLIIQFVGYGEYSGPGTVDAEVILYQDGTILIQYDNFNNGFGVNPSTVGIENRFGTDGLQVAFNAPYLHNNLALRFTQRKPLLAAVTPASGSVPAGDSQIVEVVLQAEDLEGGDYVDSLQMSTNQCGHPDTTIPIALHVIGAPNIEASRDTLDFGLVYIGSSRVESLLVLNEGTDILTVTDVASSHPDFSAAPTAFVLAAHQSRLVEVEFSATTLGAALGQLEISSDDPDEPAMFVLLLATAAMPPIVAVDPEALYDSLFSGEQSQQNLIISNSGGSDLTWTLRSEEESAVLRSLPRRSVKASLPPEPISNGRRESPTGARPAQEQALAAVTAALDDLTGKNIALLTGSGYSEIVQDLVDRGASVSQVYWPLTPAMLASLDVLVIDDSFTFTADLVSIRNWVTAGGSLFLMADDLSSMPSVNTLTAGSGISMTSLGTYLEAQLTDILPHPTTADVDTIGASAYGAYATLSPPAVEVVRDDFGRTHAAASTLGSGRLFVVGNEVAGDFQITVGQTRLFGNQIFDWLAGGVAWLAFDPLDGVTAAGDLDTVTVTFNAAGLFGGLYHAELTVSSNDPVTPEVSVPVQLRVTGAPDIEVVQDSILFDTAFVSYPDTVLLTVRNVGTDTLYVTSATSTHADFSVGGATFALAVNQELTRPVIFTPSAPGVASGLLTIHSDDPDEPALNVAVAGVAVLPPILAFSPDSLSDSLFTGETSQDTLIIVNHGSSHLDVILQVADTGAAAVHLWPVPREGVRGGAPGGEPRPAGVSLRSLEPREEAPIAQSVSVAAAPDSSILVIQNTPPWGLDMAGFILSNFGLSPAVITSSQISTTDLDPYDVVITVGDQSSNYYNDITANRTRFEDYVASGGVLQCQLATQGDNVLIVDSVQVLFQNSETYNLLVAPDHPLGVGLPDTLIGNAANHCVLMGLPAGAEVITQTVISANPTTAVYEYGSGTVIATGMTWEYLWVNSYTAGNMLYNAVAFALSSGVVPWLDLSPNAAVVLPGESLLVLVDYDATGMFGGTYRSDIQIYSNDPAQPQALVPVVLHVTGAPDIQASPDPLDFDTVFVGSTSTRWLEIRNAGTETLSVSNIVASHGDFAVGLTTFKLGPGGADSVPVFLTASSIGVIAQTLTIQTDDPDQPQRIVALRARAYQPPVMTVAPDTLTDTLFLGESAVQYLFIGNTGGYPLGWNVHVEVADSTPHLFSLPAREPSNIRPDANEGREVPGAAVVSEPLVSTLQDLTGKIIGFATAGYGALEADLIARGAVTRIRFLPIAAATLDSLTAYVIDDNIGIASGSDITNLRNWIQAGGGLFLQADDAVSMPDANALLAGSGLSATSLPFYVTAMLTDFRPHPVTDSVSAVYAISYGAYYDVTPPADTLVMDDANRPHAAAATLGGGRIVAVGNEVAGDLFQADNRRFSNQIIDWLAGGVSWVNVSPKEGITQPASAFGVGVTLSTNGLTAGVHEARVVVESTDPVTPVAVVPVILTVYDTLLVVQMDGLCPSSGQAVEGGAVAFRTAVLTDPNGLVSFDLILMRRNGVPTVPQNAPEVVGLDSIEAPNAPALIVFWEPAVGEAGVWDLCFAATTNLGLVDTGCVSFAIQPAGPDLVRWQSNHLSYSPGGPFPATLDLDFVTAAANTFGIVGPFKLYSNTPGGPFLATPIDSGDGLFSAAMAVFEERVDQNPAFTNNLVSPDSLLLALVDLGGSALPSGVHVKAVSYPTTITGAEGIIEIDTAQLSPTNRLTYVVAQAQELTPDYAVGCYAVTIARNLPASVLCPTGHAGSVVFGDALGVPGFSFTDPDGGPGPYTFNVVSMAKDGNPAVPTNAPGFTGDTFNWQTSNANLDDVGLWEFCVQVDDGESPSLQTCCFEVEVVAQMPVVCFEFGCVEDVLTGSTVCVPLSIHNIDPCLELGGFDLLFTYDASVLTFQGLDMVGSVLDAADWEYLTYRIVSTDPALIRIVAIADMNNSNHHPNTLCLDGLIANVCFKVTHDQNAGCQSAHIQWYWNDCGDNTASDPTGNILYIVTDPNGGIPYTGGDPLNGIPGGGIIMNSCAIEAQLATFEGGITGPDAFPCPNPNPAKPDPVERLCFINGKIKIICPGDIDDRGDINLNGLAYEIADAVLYSNYFISGPSVFTINVAGQTAASDVNADGTPLTVADLVYLIRVITGDALPIAGDLLGGGPKVTAGQLLVTSAQQGANVTVSAKSDADLGAGLFVFNYSGSDIAGVSALGRASGMSVTWEAREGQLRVLVLPRMSVSEGQVERQQISAGNGPILNITTHGATVELVSVEAATFMGAELETQMEARVLPTEFALHENYPNPFNPSTSFVLDLPEASEYAVHVFNIAGQLVKTFQGHAEAGRHTFTWTGRSEGGAPVASGVYFLRAQAGPMTQTRKMLMLK